MGNDVKTSHVLNVRHTLECLIIVPGRLQNWEKSTFGPSAVNLIQFLKYKFVLLLWPSTHGVQVHKYTILLLLWQSSDGVQVHKYIYYCSLSLAIY